MSEGKQAIVKIIDDPATSAWLRAACQALLRRDPVDATNDALQLARLMSDYSADVCAPWPSLASDVERSVVRRLPVKSAGAVQHIKKLVWKSKTHA